MEKMNDGALILHVAHQVIVRGRHAGRVAVQPNARGGAVAVIVAAAAAAPIVVVPVATPAVPEDAPQIWLGLVVLLVLIDHPRGARVLGVAILVAVDQGWLERQ